MFFLHIYSTYTNFICIVQTGRALAGLNTVSTLGNCTYAAEGATTPSWRFNSTNPVPDCIGKYCIDFIKRSMTDWVGGRGCMQCCQQVDLPAQKAQKGTGKMVDWNNFKAKFGQKWQDFFCKSLIAEMRKMTQSTKNCAAFGLLQEAIK